MPATSVRSTCCEKSTAYLKRQGFRNVYHLQGGILNYLERVDPADSVLLADADGGVPAWVGIEYMAQCIAVHSGLLSRAAGEPRRPGRRGVRYRAHRHRAPRGGGQGVEFPGVAVPGCAGVPRQRLHQLFRLGPPHRRRGVHQVAQSRGLALVHRPPGQIAALPGPGEGHIRHPRLLG